MNDSPNRIRRVLFGGIKPEEHRILETLAAIANKHPEFLMILAGDQPIADAAQARWRTVRCSGIWRFNTLQRTLSIGEPHCAVVFLPALRFIAAVTAAKLPVWEID